ncbi:MAG TPA: hypothetical protein VK909_04580, partial [Anaerolineales bacterium]|nr:hypothetical protein [Anaerolineales bacterium]
MVSPPSLAGQCTQSHHSVFYRYIYGFDDNPASCVQYGVHMSANPEIAVINARLLKIERELVVNMERK